MPLSPDSSSRPSWIDDGASSIQYSVNSGWSPPSQQSSVGSVAQKGLPLLSMPLWMP